jgi:hypothetical protein
VVIRRSDRAIINHDVFDVYGNITEAYRLRNVLNGYGSDVIIVVYTADEPLNNHFESTLASAMYRCGASKAVYGSSQFKLHAAYILVGIPGVGEGGGAEAYQGSVNDDPSAWCDIGLIIDNLGNYQVSANYTPRSLADYGYTGDYNATNGAPTGTSVGGTEAGLLASRALNGDSAYNAINDGTTGLAQRLRSNAANILSGAAGLAAGSLTWDANGNRTGGYGVGINKNGIVGYNSSGSPTITVDATTGNVVVSGTVYAAAGTIGGMTLSNGALCSGSFTGYSWPPSGQNGVYVGPSGILLGNANDNKYFQVDYAGGIYAPGFQLVNGQLTLTSPILINPKTSTSFSVSLANLNVSGYTNGATYTSNPIAPTISNGTGPYSYTWTFTSQTGSNIKMTSSATGVSATIQASGTNTATSGTLYVTVTDANGNSKTATATMNISFGNGF